MKSVYSGKILPLILVLAISFFLSGCDFLSGLFLGIKAQLTLKVLVSGTQNVNSANMSLYTVDSGKNPKQKNFSNTYDQVSITPSKYEITLKNIILWENYKEIDDKLYGEGKHIQVDIDKTTDLANHSALETVFRTEKDISSQQTGNYRYMELNFDELCKASGSVTMNGKSYSFENETIKLLPDNLGVPLPDDSHITIAESSKVTTGVVIDIGDILLVRYTKVYSEDAIVLNKADSIILDYREPVILPYWGSDEPTMKNLLLDITNDDTFDVNHNSNYFLKVFCVLDSAGDITYIDWIPVYGNAATGETGNMDYFEPAPVKLRSIEKNDDGSYSIDDISNNDPWTSKRSLHFPAFKLENHSGTFYYGDEGTADRKTATYDAIIVE